MLSLWRIVDLDSHGTLISNLSKSYLKNYYVILPQRRAWGHDNVCLERPLISLWYIRLVMKPCSDRYRRLTWYFRLGYAAMIYMTFQMSNLNFAPKWIHPVWQIRRQHSGRGLRSLVESDGGGPRVRTPTRRRYRTGLQNLSVARSCRTSRRLPSKNLP